MKLTLGDAITLTDGAEATLADVVVEPYHLAVTHVAVTLGSPGPTRLVPIGDLATTTDGLALACARDGFATYPVMNEVSFVRIAEPVDPGPGWDLGVADVLTMPWYSADFGPAHPDLATVVWHRVPAGEVEVRRRSRVATADDHDVGHVEGFVTDDAGHVTAVLVDHDHLFGHRDLVIPLRDIADVTNDHVRLNLTRDEVRDLPRVVVRSWWDRHHGHGQPDTGRRWWQGHDQPARPGHGGPRARLGRPRPRQVLDQPSGVDDRAASFPNRTSLTIVSEAGNAATEVTTNVLLTAPGRTG